MHNKDLLCRARYPAFFLAGTLIVLTFCLPAVSLADDYLDSLEAEADNTTMLEQAQKEQQKLLKRSSSEQSKPATKTTTAKKQKATEESASSSTTKLFEAGLYREFPGNYAVYTALSDDDKEQVLSAYEGAKDVKGLMRYGPSLTLILDFASR